MSLRIAIVGYGRMGLAVEKEATQRGHTIAFRIGAQNLDEMSDINPSTADAVIEFTHRFLTGQ